MAFNKAVLGSHVRSTLRRLSSKYSQNEFVKKGIQRFSALLEGGPLFLTYRFNTLKEVNGVATKEADAVTRLGAIAMQHELIKRDIAFNVVWDDAKKMKLEILGQGADSQDSETPRDQIHEAHIAAGERLDSVLQWREKRHRGTAGGSPYWKANGAHGLFEKGPKYWFSYGLSPDFFLADTLAAMHNKFDPHFKPKSSGQEAHDVLALVHSADALRLQLLKQVHEQAASEESQSPLVTHDGGVRFLSEAAIDALIKTPSPAQEKGMRPDDSAHLALIQARLKKEGQDVSRQWIKRARHLLDIVGILTPESYARRGVGNGLGGLPPAIAVEVDKTGVNVQNIEAVGRKIAELVEAKAEPGAKVSEALGDRRRSERRAQNTADPNYIPAVVEAAESSNPQRDKDPLYALDDVLFAASQGVSQVTSKLKETVAAVRAAGGGGLAPGLRTLVSGRGISAAIEAAKGRYSVEFVGDDITLILHKPMSSEELDTLVLTVQKTGALRYALLVRDPSNSQTETLDPEAAAAKSSAQFSKIVARRHNTDKDFINGLIDAIGGDDLPPRLLRTLSVRTEAAGSSVDGNFQLQATIASPSEELAKMLEARLDRIETIFEKVARKNGYQSTGTIRLIHAGGISASGAAQTTPTARLLPQPDQRLAA